MVIFEGSISDRVFADQISSGDKKVRKSILPILSKICAFTMFAYLFLHVLVFVHGHRWSYINSPMGYWYLTEMLGFVVLPMILFIISFRKNNILFTRIAAIFTIIGIVLNRLNVSIIAFRWDAAVHYTPSWMEIVVSLAIIFTEIWIFRWIITRMPVLREGPSWAKNAH